MKTFIGFNIGILLSSTAWPVSGRRLSLRLPSRSHLPSTRTRFSGHATSVPFKPLCEAAFICFDSDFAPPVVTCLELEGPSARVLGLETPLAKPDVERNGLDR